MSVDLSKILDQATRDVINAIEWRHQNQLLGDPGIAPGGSDADRVKISNNFHFRLQGKEYYKASADDISGTSPATQGSGVFKKVVVCIDSAGDLSLVAGDAAASQAAAELPAIPATKLALAYIEVPENFTNENTDLQAGWIKKFTSGFEVEYTSPTEA